MPVIVFFYKNGEHHVVDSLHGVSIKVDKLNSEKVEKIFVAKSKADADIAIQVLKTSNEIRSIR